jgi:hypothetical protein
MKTGRIESAGSAAREEPQIANGGVSREADVSDVLAFAEAEQRA